MTETTHGGKRDGAGRPALPDSERLSKVAAIRVTAEEYELLQNTDWRKWARATLIRAARRKSAS